jgi:Fe-Mn family superoxide dismutase
MMTRRDALKTVALSAGALAFGASLAQAQQTTTEKLVYPFKVPPLGYSYDALEPYIDALTMQIHHDKHHGAYVENLNKALADADPKIQEMSLDQLLTSLDALPEKIRTVVRNNAGGHYNHSLFWPMLKKEQDGKPSGDVAKAIDDSFGSYAAFQQQFSEAATKVFGSGWAWLVTDEKKLKIVSTPNQDTPISNRSAHEVPILGIDVWEHSYYLKYQNRRPEYVKAFWNVINWDFVDERYAAAVKA